jgi:hypothetical protein
VLGRPQRQGLEVLSISALDLFASALGVFVLVAVLMFPYYLRSPSVEIEEAGATAAFAAAGAAMVLAEREAAFEETRKAAAESALSDARRRVEEAEAAATALAAEAGRALEEAEQAVRDKAGTPERNPAALTITDLDLVMVLDATGSMAGELADLRASLLGIVRILHRLAPTLQVGFVAYKDIGEPYVTRAFPLTAMDDGGKRDLVRFVEAIRAKGGGDIPEPVDTALEAATSMDWRSGARGQILVIGDAPAKAQGWQRALDLARAFRRSSTDEERPRTLSTILTGANPGAAPFFRALAEAGGGETIEHQGTMIESVLVQVLRPAGA